MILNLKANGASDIPLTAIKTGMLGTVEMVELARDVIDKANCDIIVIDPVLVCKGTDEVLNPETAEALRDELMPRSTIITPNLFEAGQMAGFDHTPQTKEELEEQTEFMKDYPNPTYAVMRLDYLVEAENQSLFEMLMNLYEEKNLVNHLMETQPGLAASWTPGSAGSVLFSDPVDGSHRGRDD